MPVIRFKDAPTFDLDGFHFTGLAAPSRGANEICAWRIDVEPGVQSEAHWLDHEETFLVIEGVVTISVAGEDTELQEGDALVVPVRSLLQLRNTGNTTARLVACLPVGARGTMADGREVGVPMWAR